MKVLVLSQHFWPESFRINEVVESLQAAGCTVSVLTGQPNYPLGEVFEGYRASGLGRQMHPSGYTIYRVPMAPRAKGRAWQLATNYLSFLASASTLGLWALRGQRFDVVFVYGTSPILQAIAGVVIKWIKRARLVTWVQDLWPQSLEATGFVRNPRLLDAVATVVRWIYRRNDLLLVPSHAFLPTVRSMAANSPVEYHPNPGELAFEQEGTPVAPPLQLETGFNVVFAGNLGTVQAIETILDAAEQLKSHSDIRWVLVGDGSRATWTADQIKVRGLTNVTLPGRFATAAMPGIMAQASALLVSLNRNPIMAQTVPSKIPAYLAAGRPIIASMDGEGARIVCEASAGVACPAENAQALARAVLTLRDASATERERMGKAGNAYYRTHFEPAALAERLANRFKALCES